MTTSRRHLWWLLVGVAAGFSRTTTTTSRWGSRHDVRLSAGVDKYVGNQHGGKYSFDETRREAAGAGADYSSQRARPAVDDDDDDAWAEPSLSECRGANDFESLSELVGPSRGDVFASDDAAFGEVELRNDEPTWEKTIGEIVGPGREAFEIVVALGSKSSSIDGQRRVSTSLPPRRGGGRGVVIRLGRTAAPTPPAGWAAFVVVTEDAPPRVWRVA